MKVPEVESVFTVGGFSFAGSASNTGMIFTLLKPFAEREEAEKRIQGLLPQLRGMLFGIQDGLVIPFAPPSINGLGNFGGFSIQILDQSGRGNIQELGAGTQAFV